MTPRIPLTSDVFVSRRAEIEAALNEAVQAALLDHKRAGNPIAVWRDGKVVLMPPEEIQVNDPILNGSKSNGAQPSDGNGSK